MWHKVEVHERKLRTGKLQVTEQLSDMDIAFL